LNAREKYSGSRKPVRWADLLDGQVGEAQEPRGLEHDPVGDELLRRAPRDVGERPRQGGGRDGERGGVVRGVVVAAEVGLEALGEALVDVDLGVVGVTALGARVLVPALDPQEQDRQQMALQLGAAGVRRAPGLGLERGDDRLEAARLALGHLDREPAAPGEHPARRRALGGAAEQRLVAEAHRHGGHVLGAREGRDLAAADERQAARADDERPAVEEVLAPAGAQPQQLVVVVAVRLADVRAGEPQSLDPVDRNRVGEVGQAVEGEAAVIAAGCRLRAHPSRCTRYGSRPDQRIDAPAAAARSRPPIGEDRGDLLLAVLRPDARPEPLVDARSSPSPRPCRRGPWTPGRSLERHRVGRDRQRRGVRVRVRDRRARRAEGDGEDRDLRAAGLARDLQRVAAGRRLAVGEQHDRSGRAGGRSCGRARCPRARRRARRRSRSSRRRSGR
jgi:hypothetical protein